MAALKAAGLSDVSAAVVEVSNTVVLVHAPPPPIKPLPPPKADKEVVDYESSGVAFARGGSSLLSIVFAAAGVMLLRGESPGAHRGSTLWFIRPSATVRRRHLLLFVASLGLLASCAPVSAQDAKG